MPRKRIPVRPGEWGEDDLLHNIRELAQLFGWRFWHIHDSRRQVRREGMVDLRWEIPTRQGSRT